MSSQTILFLTVILLLAVIVYLLFKASLEKKNKELEVNEIIKKLDKKELQLKTSTYLLYHPIEDVSPKLLPK